MIPYVCVPGSDGVSGGLLVPIPDCGLCLSYIAAVDFTYEICVICIRDERKTLLRSSYLHSLFSLVLRYKTVSIYLITNPSDPEPPFFQSILCIHLISVIFRNKLSFFPLLYFTTLLIPFSPPPFFSITKPEKSIYLSIHPFFLATVSGGCW